MSDHTVTAVFTFKDGSSKDKFIDFCNGENGLSVTRGWKGCKSIECYESQANPCQVTIWQKWESPGAHASYVQHRHDDGSFDFLGELIASPPEITPLRPVVFETDQQQVERVIRDMCDKDHTVGIQHMAPNCVFVRPTGNPLDAQGWDAMMNNADVSVQASELFAINKLRISDNMAYVCYTSHSTFTYKGAQNDDVAVFTSVLEKSDGRWQVVLGQRSTGRSPKEAPPVFPTEDA